MPPLNNRSKAPEGGGGLTAGQGAGAGVPDSSQMKSSSVEAYLARMEAKQRAQ